MAIVARLESLWKAHRWYRREPLNTYVAHQALNRTHSKRCSNSSIALAFLCPTLAILPIRCRAETVQWQGTVHYDTFVRGKVVYSINKHFLADVAPAQWRIRTEARPAPHHQVPALLASEAYYSGKALREIDYWAAQPHRHLRGTNGVKYIRIQEKIFSQAIPLFTDKMFFPVWLAFASHAYFEKCGSIIPDITAMGRHPDPAFPCCSVNVSFRNIHGIRIPELILLTNTGKYEPLSKPARFVRYPPPYDNGFLLAQYKVLKWASTATIDLPRQAELDIFAPITRMGHTHTTSLQRPLQLSIRIRLHTDAARIIKHSKALLTPPSFADDTILVQDNRTSVRGRPLRYLSTNGTLALNTPAYKRTVKKMAAFEKRFDSGISHDRHVSLWIYVIFAPLLLVPALLWFRENSKRRNMSRYTTKK